MFFLLLQLAASQSFHQYLHYFPQISDHFRVPIQDAGTFSQRYWTVDEFWNPVIGPVILILCGEYFCDGINPERLFPYVIAERLQARVVILEHRFYGESYPYLYGEHIPPYFPLFSVEQSLADINYFISNIKQEIYSDYNVSPKWIIHGQSYSGGLAAWYRTRYPHMVAGAWASSGVIRPRANFTEHDDALYDAVYKGGIGCVQSWQAVNEYAETLYYEDRTEVITDKMNVTEDYAGYDKRPLLYAVTDLMVMLVQYGKRSLLCNELGKVSDPAGKFQKILDIYQSFSSPFSWNLYSINQLNNLQFNKHKSSRQWMWQKCTQLGYFQVHSQANLRSKLINLEYWEWFCNQVFYYPEGLKLPDTDQNERELSYHGSNILFVNGNEDPWKALSILSPVAPGQVTIEIKCRDCSHCVEVYTPTDSDPQELINARHKIELTIKEWLQLQNNHSSQPQSQN